MGRFQPGQSKPESSGRRKGTKNKKSDILADQLAALEFDVIKELVSVMPELSAEKRADTLLEMLNFIFPKRKAIEPASDEDKNKNNQQKISPIWMVVDDGKSYYDDPTAEAVKIDKISNA